jgi:hypothetical protein
MWKGFKGFLETVYTDLKTENPNLPLMFSIQLDEYYRDETVHREKLSEIMKYSDYVAVSTVPYAFSGYYNPSSIPQDFFSKVRKLAQDKPFAITQTGFPAENIDMSGVMIRGNEDYQRLYVDILMEQAEKELAKFVCWYISRDYDDLWDNEIQKNKGRDSLKIWKDTGLLDGDGGSRKALDVWTDWLGREKISK